ncbi:MAG: quinol:cytochrome C oxidoreductase [Chitinophagales bacterium]|nr:quinol:cytochrome C oxidoreductase [Chitinophagales bacterium]
MIETFVVPGRTKKIAAGLVIFGLLALIAGYFLYPGHGHGHGGHEGPVTHTRIWANLLICAYYSTGIGLAATFFIATHQIGYGGWHVLIRRIPEAMGAYLLYGGLALLAVFAIVLLSGDHQLYHWMDHSAYEPGPNYDKILDGKKGFLNIPFFAFRLICYTVLWAGTAYMLRSISRKEDEVGIQSTYKRSKYLAALFIVIFAVTNSTSSWDFIMSTDPHWYSTLFGWYNFASYTCAGFCTVVLLLAFVKGQGYMKRVNEEHFHNLGMFIFGFSVFWTYLWFSQFMLIWYANIPEETIYFDRRFENGWFKFLFFANLIINFFVPFLGLMRRKSKRNVQNLATFAAILLVGHYIDFYMMVMPNSVGNDAGFGLPEIGAISLFAGLFIIVVLNALTKASLVPVNNPYLKESIIHHTIK